MERLVRLLLNQTGCRPLQSPASRSVEGFPLLAGLHPRVVLLRAGATVSGLQSQLQGLRENMGKVSEERNQLKRDLELKNQELEGRMSTINQVKKIGRRYKTQYEDLKAVHDKVKERLTVRRRERPSGASMVTAPVCM